MRYLNNFHPNFKGFLFFDCFLLCRIKFILMTKVAGSSSSRNTVKDLLVSNDDGHGSDSSSRNVEARKPKRRKAKKRLKY